jgi:SIT4-associating protein SAP185/190
VSWSTETDSAKLTNRYPSIATEILTSELWVVSETITAYTRTLLVPFFEAVVPASPPAEDAQSIFRRTEIERAKMHYWTTEDEERERKRDVIIGLWCKVMLSLMSKRAPEVRHGRDKS